MSHTRKENNSKDQYITCFNSNRKVTDVFILLIAIYLKEKKVRYYGSANKLSPKGEVCVRSAVPRHNRLQVDNFG